MDAMRFLSVFGSFLPSNVDCKLFFNKDGNVCISVLGQIETIFKAGLPAEEQEKVRKIDLRFA